MDIIQWIGTVAAFCTTLAFLPQAIQTIRTRNTNGISLMMYSILNVGIVLWFIYGLMLHEWPIILANGITFLFAATILGLKLKHG